MDISATKTSNTRAALRSVSRDQSRPIRSPSSDPNQTTGASNKPKPIWLKNSGPKCHAMSAAWAGAPNKNSDHR